MGKVICSTRHGDYRMQLNTMKCMAFRSRVEISVSQINHLMVKGEKFFGRGSAVRSATKNYPMFSNQPSKVNESPLFAER